MSIKKHNHIGTLRERSLHAALKEWVAKPGDRFEVNLDGYVIDIMRDNLLIEIQTGNFTQIRDKLKALLDEHNVFLIYPLPGVKWIVRQNGEGEIIGRRKSPKQSRVEELFRQAIRMPEVLIHPNLTLQVVMVHMEEYWVDDGQGSWRRKYWSKADQKLVDVVETYLFPNKQSFSSLIPSVLPSPFTNRQLAESLSIRSSLAGKMTYTLRKMGILDHVGKQGNAYLFKRIV